MHITILNGNPSAERDAFDSYLGAVRDLAERRGHDVTPLVLRDLAIEPCVGCFGCWVKRPGECVFSDASADVCRAVIASDLTVFASPLIMGFVSAVTKKAMDKLIPLVHPYFAVIRNETHHRKRYERYPALGLILDKGRDGAAEDFAITQRLFERYSINFHGPLLFTRSTEADPKEVADAIDAACGA
ncbi:MAG: flavodoxin family protein [Candidatus Bipolaricaulota bacterium]|nr:MAG: flavodoxin family protein [Candidatus Bipolaricaulota bacterium]